MEDKSEKKWGKCETCWWAETLQLPGIGQFTCRYNAPSIADPPWPVVASWDRCGKWLDGANEKNRSGLVGDVLTYAMRRDNVSFPEAVELVWATIGQRD